MPTSSKVIFLWFACGLGFVTAKLDFWCVFRQLCWAQGMLPVGFASQDWLSAKCSFLSLSPFCFHQHLGHWPPWMCTLMALGVKRNQRTAAWETAAREPSKVTTLNEQQLECLNSLQDGAFLPFHRPYKESCPLACPLYVQLQTISVLYPQLTRDSHQDRHSEL